jgi:hypothetical protein
MQSIEVRKARTLAVAIGLLAAAVVYGGAQSSAAGPATSPANLEAAPERSSRATEVEAAIARNDLTARTEAALGSDFAGIWFDPPAAQVHVGFTSAAARRGAEAVAAQVGLAEAVTETRVASTWAQLDAAQARWDRRLDDLFDRSQVSTALDPKRNAVTVELASTVPAARRVALERAAAAESVDVSISVAPYPDLGVEPQARCNAFVPAMAACEPTIVGGVTIHGPLVKQKEFEESEEGEKGEDFEEEEFVAAGEGLLMKKCTAGPAVIVKKPADKATATKTYILTVGHCVDPNRAGGGVGGKWAAYNKKGVPEEVGPVIAYINNLIDVAVVEVTTKYWAKANDPAPVTPAVMPWAAKEADPLPVIQQNPPMLDAFSCVSGQKKGFSCGKIIKLNQTTTVNGVKKTELTEVQGATTEGGDSGGPWISEAEYKKGSAFVEGIHVGRKKSTGNPVFQPLSVSLPELKKQKGLDLELLTQANEKRHMVFTADSYPATVSAKGTFEDKFTAFGATTTCTEGEFSGQLSKPEGEKENTAIEVTPAYSKCTALGLPVKFVNNGCKHKMTLTEKIASGHYKATLDIVCPAGKPGIQFQIYTSHANLTSGVAMCTVTVPPQSGLKTVTLTNGGGQIVLDSGTVEAVKVKIHRNGFFCPGSGTESETTSGIYHAEKALTFSGANGEGKAINIDMAGG